MAKLTICNKRKWMNDAKSSFTGSVVTYLGKHTDSSYFGFIEISDCTRKIRLHSESYDDTTVKVHKKNLTKWLKKVKWLRDQIDDYITSIESELSKQ